MGLSCRWRAVAPGVAQEEAEVLLAAPSARFVPECHCAPPARFHVGRMRKKALPLGAGLAIGVAIGLALDSIGMGIGIGIALAIAMGLAFNGRSDGADRRALP